MLATTSIYFSGQSRKVGQQKQQQQTEPINKLLLVDELDPERGIIRLIGPQKKSFSLAAAAAVAAEKATNEQAS
jgi:hypothetical protein